MNPQQASMTAIATAMMRSRHTRVDPHPVLNDPWGDRLVPAQASVGFYARLRARRPELPAEPDAPTLRRAVDAGLGESPAYCNVIVRSRYTEDALHRALEAGVRQYVLIGAGFDSYAWRRPPEATALTVIEIDHPATQTLKTRCMAEAGLPPVPGLHFVGVDLGTRDLPAVLRGSPLRIAEPAFFSLLGVTMYLSEEANRATLRGVAETAAPGSEMVFTYIVRAFFEAAVTDLPESVQMLRSQVASLGEPLVSGFDPATLERDLRALGLRLLDDGSDDDLARRYDPQGRNGFKPQAISRIAHVRVERPPGR